MNLLLTKFKQGRGIWKLNNSLSEDKLLVNMIKDEILLIIQTYSCTPHHPDFVAQYKFNDIQLMINVDLFWDVLAAQLRGIFIRYASENKRSTEKRERELLKDIDILESEYFLCLPYCVLLTQIEEKKADLQAIRENRLKGSLIRSRALFFKLNEKPSKFFLNLENHNFVSKNIRQLKLNDGSIIQEPDNILKEIHMFYDQLYSKKDVIDIQESNFNNLVEKMPKLSETEKDKLEETITLDELKFVVTNSKNNKSPGPDGFTNEFYKTFWPEIGNFLLDLMIFYKEWGELNETQKAGVITCISKGDNS